MGKNDPIERDLTRMAELRHAGSGPPPDEIRKFLRHRSNLVVAKAARLCGELSLRPLVLDLLATFDRLMADAPKLDKRCEAVTEIIAALYELDCADSGPFLRGLHHFQLEGSFGPPVDTAARLRGISAQGLLRTRHPHALHEVMPLLLDKEAAARIGAVRALALNGGETGTLLLKMKVLSGDSDPEVLGECFAGLLSAWPEKAVGFVANYVEAGDAAIAEAAILALGESKQPSAFAALKEKWERTVRRETRSVLLLAMASSRLEEAIEFLISTVSEAPARIAVEALQALAIYRSSARVRDAVQTAVSRRNEKPVSDAFKEQFPED
jgi:hypothetical protein